MVTTERQSGNSPCGIQRGYYVALAAIILCSSANAHEKSQAAFSRQVALLQADVDANAEKVSRDPQRTCLLTVDLIDSWSKKSVAGLVRITNLASGKPLQLDDQFHRAANWYALDRMTSVRVPQQRLRVEALRGLRTELTVEEIDLSGRREAKVSLSLNEFYETQLRGIYAGNTHLHLRDLTHAEADRYLRVVPQADNLDLVFLSHLRRVPDERHYISNQIVENSLAGGDLERLSASGVLFGNGQEHRHNFGEYGEGYGHVMLLGSAEAYSPGQYRPGYYAARDRRTTLARGNPRCAA